MTQTLTLADLPDHVTYDARQSSYPTVLVWSLGFFGIPSPKKRELRADAQKPDPPEVTP